MWFTKIFQIFWNDRCYQCWNCWQTSKALQTRWWCWSVYRWPFWKVCLQFSKMSLFVCNYRRSLHSIWKIFLENFPHTMQGRPNVVVYHVIVCLQTSHWGSRGSNFCLYCWTAIFEFEKRWSILVRKWKSSWWF